MLFFNGAMLYDVQITFPAAIAIVDDDDDSTMTLFRSIGRQHRYETSHTDPLFTLLGCVPVLLPAAVI